jgi:hypothetical protein
VSRFDLIGACLAALPLACLGADCSSEWALTGKGVPLGSAHDHLVVAADGGITVSSAFTPSGILALFGVRATTRQFVLDSHRVAQSRTETRAGDRPEENVWRRSDGLTWERSLNGTQDRRDSVADGLVIDSTSFPYLLRLGVIDATAAELHVTVITKGKPYPAELSLRALEQGPDVWLLSFRSADNSGTAWLDKDYRPIRWEFLDEHGAMRGALTAWSCK